MMRRLLLASAFFLALALPVDAGSGLAVLPQSLEQRLTYRIVRNLQTLTGQQTTSSTFTIVRRAGTTLVIERTGPNGAPNLSVLKMNADGSLALADPKTASDGDLNDVLYGLNVAIAATREGDPNASGTWLAVVPIAPSASATSAPVVLVPATNGKPIFDFSGSAETSAGAPLPARRVSSTSGFPGGGMGGGFPGGGRRSHGDDASAPDGGNDARGVSGPIALTIRIDGHAVNGFANRVTITQTRTVTIATLPYVNVGSWTMTVGP